MEKQSSLHVTEWSQAQLDGDGAQYTAGSQHGPLCSFCLWITEIQLSSVIVPMDTLNTPF